MQRLPSRGWVALTAALLPFAAGCGGGDGPTAPDCFRNICPGPDRLLLDPGQRATITLFPKPGWSISGAVTWYSDPYRVLGQPEYHDPLRVAQSGDVTAVRPGRTVVWATMGVQHESGARESDNAYVPVTVRGVWVPELEDSLTLYVSEGLAQRRDFAVYGVPRVFDADSVGQEVRWRLADTSIAGITPTGELTARRVGRTRLTVSSVAAPHLPARHTELQVKWCVEWSPRNGCVREGTAP